MSAYMLWLNANREKIKSDHPGISITDLSKKAGELWKAMSKEKKEVRDGASGLLCWWGEPSLVSEWEAGAEEAWQTLA